MTEAPKVYCPKEKKEVPVWWCLGSFIQKKETCPELIETTVNVAENYARVVCKQGRIPAIWLVEPEDGDYHVGELYFGKNGWVMFTWKEENKLEEAAVGEWSEDSIELEEGTLFRPIGRNMEIIDKILTERALIREHRKKIEKLKEQLKDPITEGCIRGRI